MLICNKIKKKSHDHELGDWGVGGSGSFGWKENKVKLLRTHHTHVLTDPTCADLEIVP